MLFFTRRVGVGGGDGKDVEGMQGVEWNVEMKNEARAIIMWWEGRGTRVTIGGA